MRLMGAEVIPVHSGSATLKDACNEALRDWSGSYETAHYMLGTVAEPLCTGITSAPIRRIRNTFGDWRSTSFAPM